MTFLRVLLRRRAPLDFSDYLELRRLRDEGDDAAEIARAITAMAHALPVAFAAAIPNLATLAQADRAPPRGLPREALHVLFEMRAEFTQHGKTRARMMGFDLPDASDALKDWLDFIEAERRNATKARALLRDLDRRIWAVMSGNRHMPAIQASLLAEQPSARPMHESL